ncbi:hypothetical protein FPQ18DRAFT_350791 [Pyronema domesticum]|uniref:GPI anchored serine-threonine rich protein n=1 Tax=Pyronema omphalodes (strain CBS 100304) TaxID=1076935 RepID=U4LVX5_PYROM|nr:hypothetical protein FPQ18DRAFT_350791 [Pyronema domesticum]CCX34957.1 Similar to hypothetical protein PAAG_03134 [Paracoccidioides brasiliensis Pb01]; acc. no. XP_002794589 [Pyronema omphalodes CBS 100304]
MRATVLSVFAVALSAAAVSAQVKECDAQNILDACKSQYEPRLAACTGNDWECYCTEATNLKQCYNVCPNVDKSGVSSQVVSYCGAFSQQKSAAAAATSTASGATIKPASTSAPTGTSDAAAGTTTGSAPAATSSAANAGVVVTPGVAGVVLGMVGAVAGAFL